MSELGVNSVSRSYLSEDLPAAISCLIPTIMVVVEKIIGIKDLIGTYVKHDHDSRIYVF